MPALLILLLVLMAACTNPNATTTKVPPVSQSWFTEIAGQSNLNFTHNPGATGDFHMPEIMGSGAALFDYDADGDLDVFLVQGSSQPKATNKLFRNEVIPTGKLTFTDATQAARLDHPATTGMGATVGDIDNDGRPDLLVTNFATGNILYRNQGDGTFQDVTAQSPGVALPGLWSTSASFFDYDNDGWLDLAILNYIDYSYKTSKKCSAPTGEPDYCTPRVYRSLPSHLFHNDHGKFTDVTAKSGIDQAAGPALGVAALDANEDGLTDLFIANDSSANHLWIQNPKGFFREQALQSGLAYAENGLAKAGMGIGAGDYDNDGDVDLLVLNLMREGATLFRNDGKGNFTDASLATGIHAATVRFTGFGVAWADFDRDAWPDLFLANGAVTRREEQRGKPYPFEEHNLLLRNSGGGVIRFSPESAESSALATPGVSRAAAFGDIDNDGDIDILINVNNGPARLLRNDTQPRNWLQVKIDAPGLGIGSRIEVKAPGLPAQNLYVRTDSSYLASSDTRVTFGLAAANTIESVTITNPGTGKHRRFDVSQVKVNSLLTVR